MALASQGIAEFILQQFDRAETSMTDALTRFQDLGDTWSVMYARTYLGLILVQQGNHERAAAILVDALRSVRVLRRCIGVPDALTGLAATALAQGRVEPAIRLAGAANALSKVIGQLVMPAVQAVRENYLARAQLAG